MNRKYKFEDESMCYFENRLFEMGFTKIAGIDEAGRGALAGPVVAACVLLDPENIPSGINDSKKLSVERRRFLFDKILISARALGVGIVGPEIIDRVNILNATRIAMEQALLNMGMKPDFLLIDAVKLYDISISSISINKGDERSVSIAAASIIAKVYRDDLMTRLSRSYPEYRFSANKGYGTFFHLNALERYGPTEVHRLSFNPVHEMQERWKLKEHS
ncbi:MAG: ribonuclease HII [Spirochaetota bacterium]